MSGATGGLLVLGLGNPDRGDDAVGERVVRALETCLPNDVTTALRRGDMLGLIEDWAGFEALVCIDASAPMGSPGRIRRIDLASDALPPDMARASSHALGLAEAIELARALGLAPRKIVVYAIEGCRFETGRAPSAEVSRAVPVVAKRVLAEIAAWRRETAQEKDHA